MPDAESRRLADEEKRIANWKRWGPYLSERQWGTVREDYSPGGASWTSFSHDHARSRAYRWGEDGLLGFTDRQCRLCFAIALWNENDPILKERLFGLTGPEGNHGEDVKELYYYLQSTPTHSYFRSLYKYPFDAFPYARLVEENRRRDRYEREFEILDTGVFDDSRYFDVYAEYAKAGPDDILIRVHLHNRSKQEPHALHCIPTLWFRNTWAWGCKHEGCWIRPSLRQTEKNRFRTRHATLEDFEFFANGSPAALLTDNETNTKALFNEDNAHPHTKDAFHQALIGGDSAALRSDGRGTKLGLHYRFELAPGAHETIELRLRRADLPAVAPFDRDFGATFADRRAELDTFYDRRIATGLSADERSVSIQAYAGLLHSKQFYHYVVEDWLDGDPEQPAPPESRRGGRNRDWMHLFNRDVVSMPDKWEYPWYAAWDLAFHMIPFARVDPAFAKRQLTLLLREWYMHPNGQIPAYEFEFSDVNPPVHAWAVWRTYKRTGPRGERDVAFLARSFHKLLLNFTWWVNRKDLEGNHIFSGGFLGLDNIGVFDRSRPLPTGGQLEQADATAWMAFYCTTMLAIALELAAQDPSYEDVASKFFEHFVAIVDAINGLGGSGLWNEEDGFYYDQLHQDDAFIPLRVRSMVGLVPLFAVLILDEDVLQLLPGFTKRTRWFLENRKDLSRHIAYLETQAGSVKRLLAIPSRERLERVLAYVFDENEFLSDFGIRSLSKAHEAEPFVFESGGEYAEVSYLPGESDSGMFGGNSNWRGPIWFPMNFLLIEALEQYHHFYGDEFKIEVPTGSGHLMTLDEAALEISKRLARLFVPDESGRRPAHGPAWRYRDDPAFRELVLFYEYFHGDTGEGLGAAHQTGWTALVIDCLDDLAERG